MSTPDLHLKTLLVLDDEGRILSTREPQATRGPLFGLICGPTACAWAIRADVPADLAGELERLARDEAPTADLRDPPAHAERYISLFANRIAPGQVAAKTSQSDGPAFEFPDTLPPPSGIVLIEDERLLEHHFRGWGLSD